MGLKSLIFRRSGAARQLEQRKEELKQKLQAARGEVATLKEALRQARLAIGQPPPRTPEMEVSLAAAAKEMRSSAPASPVPDINNILGRVLTAASEHDIMLKKSTPEHYLQVGVSALEAMHRAAPDLSLSPPRRILDFGCGFGRVARFLRAAWPEADLTICDVDFAGLAFCMAHLGMRGFPVGTDPSRMNLGSGYDLIWVGSVVTHLNATLIRQLLEALGNALAPAGRLFFTAHGDHPAAMMKAGRNYDLAPEALPKVVSDFEQTGFGYADYPKSPGYGVSLTAERWMRDLLASISTLECVSYEPKGWAAHQDVIACVRR